MDLFKKRLFFLLWFVGGLFAFNAVGQGLDSMLRRLGERDQAVRRELIRWMQHQPVVADSLYAASLRMEAVDAENQRIVSELLDAQGWPEGISDEAHEAIWLVIDHADLEMQRRYLPVVEARMQAGYIRKSSYVTLLDRVLMREGRPQRYGTQTVSLNRTFVDGESHPAGQAICYLWPVESPEQLDSLRAAADLEPIDEYLRLVGESYGMNCIWDRSLRVEDLSSAADEGGVE